MICKLHVCHWQATYSWWTPTWSAQASWPWKLWWQQVSSIEAIFPFIAVWDDLWVKYGINLDQKNRGYHLHVACWSVCDCDQVFWLAKSVLDCLITWFLRVKGQIAPMHSWPVDFSSSEVTLIPWSAPKKGFDPLIQFWSQLQHGSYQIVYQQYRACWNCLFLHKG